MTSKCFGDADGRGVISQGAQKLGIEKLGNLL